MGLSAPCHTIYRKVFYILWCFLPLLLKLAAVQFMCLCYLQWYLHKKKKPMVMPSIIVKASIQCMQIVVRQNIQIRKLTRMQPNFIMLRTVGRINDVIFIHIAVFFVVITSAVQERHGTNGTSFRMDMCSNISLVLEIMFLLYHIYLSTHEPD